MTRRERRIGYTHYYYQKRELDKDKFVPFAKDINTLLSKADIPLTGVEDLDGFIADENMIWFNGKADDAHETFVLERVYRQGHEQVQDNLIFNFCKTAQKPYDKYVVATLVLAKLYFGDDIKISSDGNISDWQEGVALLNNVLDYEISMTSPTSLNVEEAIIKGTIKVYVTEEEFVENINNPVYE